MTARQSVRLVVVVLALFGVALVPPTVASEWECLTSEDCITPMCDYYGFTCTSFAAGGCDQPTLKEVKVCWNDSGEVKLSITPLGCCDD